MAGMVFPCQHQIFGCTMLPWLHNPILSVAWKIPSMPVSQLPVLGLGTTLPDLFRSDLE